MLQTKLDDMTELITKAGAVAGGVTVGILLVRFALAFMNHACCKVCRDGETESGKRGGAGERESGSGREGERAREGEMLVACSIIMFESTCSCKRSVDRGALMCALL